MKEKKDKNDVIKKLKKEITEVSDKSYELERCMNDKDKRIKKLERRGSILKWSCYFGVISLSFVGLALSWCMVILNRLPKAVVHIPGTIDYAVDLGLSFLPTILMILSFGGLAAFWVGIYMLFKAATKEEDE